MSEEAELLARANAIVEEQTHTIAKAWAALSEARAALNKTIEELIKAQERQNERHGSR